LPNRIPLPQSNRYRRLILYFKIVSFPPVTQQSKRLCKVPFSKTGGAGHDRVPAETERD